MSERPPDLSYRVPRTCTRVGEKAVQPCSIESLRELDAYVLLGDPGIGKSEAFRAEAKATGGIYKTARDFVALSLPNLSGETVFIDGLDENRSGTADGNTALDAIRRKLDAHGTPRFRISCREADWFGATDREALAAVAPGGEIGVFALDPLTKDDVVSILAHEPYALDGARFIEEAEQRGLDGLLFNPQTLSILAEAIQSANWPKTKSEAYELACAKMAAEHNDLHKRSARGQQASPSSILDAAGALSSILLLANLEGFTLYDSDEKTGKASIQGIALIDSNAAGAAIRSRLFTAAAEGAFAPVHRTVSEYLAARFIAGHVGSNGLVMARVLALTCGDDGRPVTALRGLNAWLATLHAESRRRTIRQDPLGVILYGDPARFTAEEKQRLLQELKRAQQEHPSLRSYSSPSKPFGVLATADMSDYIDAELGSSARDTTAQLHALCLMDAVRYGTATPALKRRILGIVHDPSWWSAVRQNALKTYARTASASELLPLTVSIASGQLSDSDDQLLGMLLKRLYPQTIAPNAVAEFLHSPQQARTYGSYLYFWDYNLPDLTRDQDLAALLTGLSQSAHIEERSASRPDRVRLGRTIGKLVVRALECSAFDDLQQLYDWLGLLCRVDGGDAERPHIQAVVTWLESHPDEHIRLLRIAIEATQGSDEPSTTYGYAAKRFYEAKWPPGMGLVWLEHADKEHETTRMDWLFARAMTALFNYGSASGLTLEHVVDWVRDHPRYAEYLNASLFYPLDEWYQKLRDLEFARKEKEATQQASRRIKLRTHLPNLMDGSASVSLLDDMAQLYLGRASFRRGASMESFTHFLCGDDELIAAAFVALRAVPFRQDIPTPSKILETHGRNKKYRIQHPLLAGLKLLHERDQKASSAVPEDVLRSGLVFDLLDGHERDVLWREHLLQSNPALVAETLELYLKRMFAIQEEHIPGHYDLLHEEKYRDVARQILPSLIRSFPVRSRPGQATTYLFGMSMTLSHRIDRQDFLDLVQEKLAQTGLRLAHRLCLLTAALLQDPDGYLLDLCSFVGDSGPRWRRLKALLSYEDTWSKPFVESSGALAWLLARTLPRAPVESYADDEDDDGRVGKTYTESKNLRLLVIHLGRIPSRRAATDIANLLNLPLHDYWRQQLQVAQANQRIAMREDGYVRPSVGDVSQTLLNLDPANARDLAELVLVHLDDLATGISEGSFDAYRFFWNVTPAGQVTRGKPENDCRDVLFHLLEPQFVRLGVDVRREPSYARNKRADARITFAIRGRRTAVPVEVKRNTHKEVWEAPKTQLLEQYARDPESAGVGIYLVLWFGPKRMRRPPAGPPPRTAQEMQAMLVYSLDAESRDRIFVRVIDCSGGDVGTRHESKSASGPTQRKAKAAAPVPKSASASSRQPAATLAPAKKGTAKKSSAIHAPAKLPGRALNRPEIPGDSGL